MLSRHADACFWIGRYIERVECTARMVDVHYHFRLEESLAREETLWNSILLISGEDEPFLEKYGEAATEDERTVLNYFCFDRDNPSSVLSSLERARENARGIRQQISSEMWEIVNRAYLDISSMDVDKVLKRTPHAFFTGVKSAAHLFQGIADRTLMDGQSRDFLDLGRYLERAGQTARILDVKYHALLPRFRDGKPPEPPSLLPEPDSVGGPMDVHGWIAVLRSVGGLEAFRKTHPASTDPTQIAGFILLNPDFPSAVRYCADQVHERIERLTAQTGARQDSQARFGAYQLRSKLASATPSEVVTEGLHGYLEDVLDRCDEIGAAIGETFLQY